MEFVRREMQLRPDFGEEEFQRALVQFRQTYNVNPERGVCAPDVLARFAEVFGRAGDSVHGHSTRLQFLGIPLVAGIVPPGTVVFEGNVDDVKMGDW